jgi:hypothetical protein
MSITNPNTCFELYKSGKKLSFKQQCLAKCADCMNRFLDGREDCLIPTCPLYPSMPYRIKSNAVNDIENNETGSTKPKKVLSPEHLAKLAMARKNKANKQ